MLRKLLKNTNDDKQKAMISAILYEYALINSQKIESRSPSIDQNEHYLVSEDFRFETFFDIDGYARELRKAPIYWPGSFWNDRNKRFIDELDGVGLNDFKRTFNHSLGNFLVLDVRSPEFRDMLGSIDHHGSNGAFSDIRAPYDARTFEKALALNPSLSAPDPQAAYAVYSAFCSLVWDRALLLDEAKVIPRMSEPLKGNPYRIERGDRLISQDLARSAIEYNTISRFMNDNPVVLEIGAGYGRLAHAFYVMGVQKYIIVDIAPTLFLAQTYIE